MMATAVTIDSRKRSANTLPNNERICAFHRAGHAGGRPGGRCRGSAQVGEKTNMAPNASTAEYCPNSSAPSRRMIRTEKRKERILMAICAAIPNAELRSYGPKNFDIGTL